MIDEEMEPEAPGADAVSYWPFVRIVRRISASSWSIERSRRRPWHALAAVLTVGAGLLWRSGVLPLPDFAVKYGGDALWATVVFLGFGFLFRNASTWRVAAMALCLAWAVEFSQLYHAGWIDEIRRTPFGRLTLGFTFNAPDLLAYAAGVAFGAVAEAMAYRYGANC